MYFLKKQTGKYSYVFLVESVYLKDGKKSTTRTIKNYGRYDKLPPDFRKKLDDAKAQRELAKAIERDIRAQELEHLAELMAKRAVKPEFQSHENFNRAFALNYGHLALKPIWDNELNLQYKVEYLQKKKTKVKGWKINDLLFYLCSLKIIDPKSYLSAYQAKSNFVYCPWSNVVQDNFYWALDFVYNHREALIEHAVKSHLDKNKREVKVAFFDCTNTWFETPYDDLTWQIIRFTRSKSKELQDHGFCSEEIDAYLNSDDFAKELSEELEVRKNDILRMRGKSKEGRFAQPIVTVALAIDQTGFPIDCKVYAGNLSEIHTVEPMLESLRKKYSVKDVYFVADRGLNSGERLESIQQKNFGFVVAQKVSRQTKANQDQMLDLQGYCNYRMDHDGSFHSCPQEPVLADSYRFKVCDHEKTFTKEETDPSTGEVKRKKVSMKCKIVYTFSPQRQARDLAELDEQIAKASKAVKEGYLAGNAFGTGWRALLKTKKEEATNKADKEQYRTCGLKEDVIEERKKIAGYAALVFSHPEGKNIEVLSDEQVLSTYHRLLSIEDCFRTMKSSFSIRPVHLRQRERVIAHCYLCVLSLMMMKILQERLEVSGHPMSCQQISSALAQAFVVPLPSPDGQIRTFLNLGLTPQFYAALTTGKAMTIQDVDQVEDSDLVWKNYSKNLESTPFCIDQIFEAMGLKKLTMFSTMPELKKNLAIGSVPASSMLAPEYIKYFEATCGQ